MKTSRKPTALAVRYGSEEAGLDSEELAERMRQAGHADWTGDHVSHETLRRWYRNPRRSG